MQSFRTETGLRELPIFMTFRYLKVNVYSVILVNAPMIVKENKRKPIIRCTTTVFVLFNMRTLITSAFVKFSLFNQGLTWQESTRPSCTVNADAV